MDRRGEERDSKNCRKGKVFLLKRPKTNIERRTDFMSSFGLIYSEVFFCHV